MLDHRQQIERELIQRCFNHRAVFRIAAASLSKLPVDDLDRKATIVIGCSRIRQFEQFPLNGLEAKDGTYGIESMCVAGGMGMAMLVERL